MGTNDGTITGLTTVLNNGSNSDRFNIVFLAEGFTNTQQTDFNNHVDNFITALQNEPWFDTLIAAINVHRINVESDDAGADEPAACSDGNTGPGTSANTYFDASYCNSGIYRCLAPDWSLVRDTLNAEISEWHVGVVLVNSTRHGGCASGDVNATAMTAGWINTVMHELGHSLGLADEYNYWEGCGSGETGHDNFTGSEPGAPNVTTVTSRSALKWAHLVEPLTPIPTMENPDCSLCDANPNALSNNDKIGLFEGASYYHCGKYRPAYNCRMRSSGHNFCRVCVEAIHDVLRPHFGTVPVIAADNQALNFGNLGTGGTLTQDIEISNVGTVDVTGITVTVDNGNFSVTLPEAPLTLTAGVSAIVNVTLGPVYIVGAQSGTVSISSNAVTLDISVQGHICIPAPDVQVVSSEGGLSLNFGEVAHNLTIYRSVEIRNRRTACPGPLPVTLSPLTGPYGYAPGTALSFTLPTPNIDEDYTSEEVFISFTGPTTGGPTFVDSVRIDTPDDSDEPYTDISLSGISKALEPVDSILVIDRSGSMSDTTGIPGKDKCDLAIEAADLYVSLLKDNDRIGIVRYNQSSSDPADVLSSLEVAGASGSGGGRDNALTALTRANLMPSGSTSIGSGLLNASSQLDSAVADARAIVCLTDGRQNKAPDIPTASVTISSKSPKQRVFSVGLGLNQLEDKLIEIASVTNGFAQVTGDVLGDREFILQKLYVQILSDVSDTAFVRDPHLTIGSGQQVSTDVWLSEVDVATDFIVVYRRSEVHPKYMTIWLEAPDGTLIHPSQAASMPNVEFNSGKNHFLFRWTLPAFPDRPAAHIGRWRVWIKNNNVVEWHGEVPLNCAVMCTARSNLRLGGHVRQQTYEPGSSIVVVLEPTLFGVPVKLDTPVVARVRRPDGVIRLVDLKKNDYGQYVGKYPDTHLNGAYSISAEVYVTTPQGERVTRYRQMTGLIFRAKTNSGQSECCAEALKILRRFEMILKRCCANKINSD